MSGEIAIEVSDLTMSFGQLTAYRSLDLRVSKGRFVVLIGPSGCGKSTLLRNIADLLQSTGGTIRVFGDRPQEVRRQRRISFVFQEATLLPWRWLWRMSRCRCRSAAGRHRGGRIAIRANCWNSSA